MEYNLVDKENTINSENLNLLQKKREIKKNKYKLYFVLSFVLFASCIFLFWFYGMNSKQSNIDLTEFLVGVENIEDINTGHAPTRPYSIFYALGINNQDQKFCGVNFEPYFSKESSDLWHDVDMGNHKYTFKEDNAGHARAYRHFFTQYWRPTEDPDEPVEILIEGRFQPEQKILFPNNLTIAKRFTLYDGFLAKSVGKLENENALQALVQSHSCNFKYMNQFNLAEPTEYNSWCALTKTDPETKWLMKFSNGQHGHGMHIVDEKALHQLCKTNHRDEYHMVVQEFLQNPALVNGGYKFHIRWMGFVVTDPFVTYWSPRHSYLRIADQKYGTKNPSQYISNADDCSESKIGCYAYDTDFIELGWMSEAQWKKASDIMSKQSHMLVKAYYGRNIFEGKTSKNRFTWFGFDYMMDDEFTPIFTEWNEEPIMRNLEVPLCQRRMGNFVDGMFSIVNGYVKKIPQIKIDSIARKYQILKLKTIDDDNDWVL